MPELPRQTGSELVVAPPSGGAGNWAGGPSAVVHESSVFLAYRLRRPIGSGRGYANVIARSHDGVTFTPVAEVSKERFGGASLERPALVVTPEGRWRLYVSVATPGTKHWRVDLLEADEPEKLGEAPALTVLPGSDEIGVKDPVLHFDGRRWHLWASVHPLETAEHADRMSTWYATGPDGVDWTWQGVALAPRPGRWDARGVRLSAVTVRDGQLTATYDGRATAEENWEERTGTAHGTLGPDGLFGPLTAADAEPCGSPHAPHGLRYLTAVPGRLYYEVTREDGAHELRTEPSLDS
ncbi:hypothetical protein ACFO1B_36230 [Dactylosporangium siamense]|uniref:Uncharacterized protein n=1 Tax=Dactylosporangium siamense TaxID=685454 RepID=A0A919PPA7_9ACTN|nr:hypothetical protein [Dactylosporangium siamense]GIG46025.1 hypothetical protein Dsi01nite_040660 [Dactylosporangium siamense]